MPRNLKIENKVILYSILAAAIFWVVDAVVDALLHYDAPFLHILLLNKHELSFRGLFSLCFLIFGVIMARLLRRQKQIENRQRAILDGIPDLAWLKDKEGRFIAVNESFAKLANKPPHEIVGKTDLDIWPRDLAEKYRSDDSEVIESRRRKRVEERLEDKDGNLRWIETIKTPFCYEKDSIAGTVGIARDITERRLAQAALRKTEEELATISANLAEGIYVLDQEGNITFMNPEAERLLGWTKEELNEKGGHDLVHYQRPDGSPLAFEDCKMQLVLKTGERYSSTDEVFVRRDGVVFPISVISAPIFDNGRAVASVNAFQDITEFKQAERVLRDLNRNFVTLLENTTDFIYFKDKESRFIFCSQSMAEITGNASWRDMIGKHDLEVFPEETAKIYCEEELPIFKNGTPLLNKIDPFYDQQGKTGWVNTNKWPVFDGKNRVIGIFGISRDITAQKRAEDALKEVNKELQSKASELERAYKDMESFSYAVSHDLKAPVIRIGGFVNMITEDYGDTLDENVKNLLDRVSSNTTHMSHLIEDLLVFFRYGHKKLEKSKVDIGVLGTFIFQELKADTAGRNMRFETNNPPPAYCDPAMIRQVLLNLIANAIKFTRTREEALIEFGGYPEKNQNVYFVRDNGIGFDPRFTEKLFGLFQRVHTSKQFEGTGVGLVIVQKIIESHNGKVWAEGKPDEGATFFFTLPHQ